MEGEGECEGEGASVSDRAAHLSYTHTCCGVMVHESGAPERLSADMAEAAVTPVMPALSMKVSTLAAVSKVVVMSSVEVTAAAWLPRITCGWGGGGWVGK